MTQQRIARADQVNPVSSGSQRHAGDKIDPIHPFVPVAANGRSPPFLQVSALATRGRLNHRSKRRERPRLCENSMRTPQPAENAPCRRSRRAEWPPTRFADANSTRAISATGFYTASAPSRLSVRMVAQSASTKPLASFVLLVPGFAQLLSRPYFDRRASCQAFIAAELDGPAAATASVAFNVHMLTILTSPSRMKMVSSLA